MSELINKMIFPFPFFDTVNIKIYKEYLIHIPTKNEIEKIPCLFIKNEQSDKILIIFHCNGADMFNIFDFISDLSGKYNINVLIPEYPGYSIYDSPLSSDKCLENSLIIYDFILNNINNITEKNIYVLGRSLGTGPAVYVASKRNPAGTFLISPYTTFGAVGRNHSEEIFNGLSKNFRSIDYVDKIKTPLFIIHGTSDKLIKYEEAQKLYEKCRNDIIKEIKLVNDMGHNYSYKFLCGTIIPYIIEFANKHCNLKNFENEKIKENKVIIDFDKKFYELPKKLETLLEEDILSSESCESMEFKMEEDSDDDYNNK